MSKFNLITGREAMEKITIVGIDLAKISFLSWVGSPYGKVRWLSSDSHQSGLLQLRCLEREIR